MTRREGDHVTGFGFSLHSTSHSSTFLNLTHLLLLSSLFRARIVYHFVLACHLCYPKGSSRSVNVSVALALIMETGRTESRSRNKHGTDIACLWDVECTRVEKDGKGMVENSQYSLNEYLCTVSYRDR